MNNRNPVLGFESTKLVECIYENRHYGLQRFNCATKATASPGKHSDIVPQIGIDAFDGERVAFIAYVSHIFPWIHHIDITQIAIAAILVRGRSRINDPLYPFRRFVEAHVITNDLPWLTAYHRDQIHVFAALALSFPPEIPV